MPLNWFDVVILILILMSVIAGLRSGLARVVVGLVATVVGVLLGFWCYRLVAANLQPYVGTAALADILGFVAIFVGVLIVGSLIAALLARIFRWIGLSWFDHFLGGVAGFFRGILVVAGLAAILVAFVPAPAPPFLAHSRILPYASEIAAALAEAAPKDLKDSFLQQWDNLKQYWAHPANGHSSTVAFARTVAFRRSVRAALNYAHASAVLTHNRFEVFRELKSVFEHRKRDRHRYSESPGTPQCALD